MELGRQSATVGATKIIIIFGSVGVADFKYKINFGGGCPTHLST
jgi:hypothetical protein